MVQFIIDSVSSVPFYRQIIDMVLAGIASGRLVAGEQLPTIRRLAQELKVNANTVVKAYSQLQMLGAVQTQQGLGIFISDAPAARQSAAERARALDELCRDFVARAQLFNLTIPEIVATLQRMQKPK